VFKESEHNDLGLVVAILEDLLFRSKLETMAAQLGAELTMARDAGPALAPGTSVSRVLIDLNMSGDPLAVVRDIRAAQPGVPVIGFCSHVQQELQQQALAAGCTQVLPRSAFVQRMMEFLT
jgi:CheY-like chemotaxis protein